jgi:hypothetical protein
MYALRIDVRFVIPKFVDTDFAKFLRKCVSEYTGISEEAILSHSRKRATVRARHLTALALWRYSELTLKVIGQLIGDKDHTTVIHALGLIEGFFDIKDPEIMLFVKPFLDRYDAIYGVTRRVGTSGNHNI